MAIKPGDTLTVAWDGRPVGLLHVTKCHFRLPQGVYPAAWMVDGTFTPHPAFDDCRTFFDERVRLEQEYDEAEPEDVEDEAEPGDAMAAAFEAMHRAAGFILEHATVLEVGRKLFSCHIFDDGTASVSLPPVSEPGALGAPPAPSHLVGWTAEASFEGELLKATVRCPCGCDRIEFNHAGATHLHSGGSPIPCSAEIRQEWFFIIKAVCTACRADRVLFDSHFHGCGGFLNPDSERARLARPRLWVWRCVECGGTAHQGRVSVVEDYRERYVKGGYAETFGADRWPDAFGCFEMSIRCRDCNLESPGWVSYEAR